MLVITYVITYYVISYNNFYDEVAWPLSSMGDPFVPINERFRIAATIALPLSTLPPASST